MEESRERMDIASIHAVIEWTAQEELENMFGMCRPEIREWILETGYIQARVNGLKTSLRRVDVNSAGNGNGEVSISMDIYGDQPECIRNIPVAW
jgi:hypothetical protein